MMACDDEDGEEREDGGNVRWGECEEGWNGQRICGRCRTIVIAHLGVGIVASPVRPDTRLTCRQADHELVQISRLLTFVNGYPKPVHTDPPPESAERRVQADLPPRSHT